MGLLALVSACGTGGPIDPYRMVFEKLRPRPGEALVRPAEIHALAEGRVVSRRQMLDRLREADVVHLGEAHDHRGVHAEQARIVAELMASGRRVAVGLEMLPPAARPALEAYVQGRLVGADFLKQVQWYRRWGFDFRYYQAVFEAARDNKAAILGLNAPRELVSRVGRGGLDALSNKQRSQLPAINLESQEHRRLFAALIGMADAEGPHRGLIDRLYQAQSVWDEVMADSVLRALAAPAGPEQVLVVAGNGHVAYGLGIAARLARRRPELRQATVMILEVERSGRRVAGQLADYVIGVAEGDYRQKYPVLGVGFGDAKKRDSENTAPVVRSFAHGRSPAKRAGMRKGDRVLSVDGHAVATVFELRWQLQRKDWGDTVVLEVEQGGKRRTISVRFDKPPANPHTVNPHTANPGHK